MVLPSRSPWAVRDTGDLLPPTGNQGAGMNTHELFNVALTWASFFFFFPSKYHPFSPNFLQGLWVAAGRPWHHRAGQQPPRPAPAAPCWGRPAPAVTCQPWFGTSCEAPCSPAPGCGAYRLTQRLRTAGCSVSCRSGAGSLSRLIRVG